MANWFAASFFSLVDRARSFISLMSVAPARVHRIRLLARFASLGAALAPGLVLVAHVVGLLRDAHRFFEVRQPVVVRADLRVVLGEHLVVRFNRLVDRARILRGIARLALFGLLAAHSLVLVGLDLAHNAPAYVACHAVSPSLRSPGSASMPRLVPRSVPPERPSESK